jgi:3-methyladenine DNA glycosylase AlkD
VKLKTDDQVKAALAWLKKHSKRSTRERMSRYAIPSDNAYGVAMKDIKSLGKQLGQSNDLAIVLWDTGVYEARMLVSFVADPALLTSRQVDRWTSTTGPFAMQCVSTCSTVRRTVGRK